jgi:hypothetical protein
MEKEYNKLMRKSLDDCGKAQEARMCALKDIFNCLREEGFNLNDKRETWHVSYEIIMSKPLRLKVFNVFTDNQKVNFKTL